METCSHCARAFNRQRSYFRGKAAGICLDCHGFECKERLVELREMAREAHNYSAGTVLHKAVCGLWSRKIRRMEDRIGRIHLATV